MRLKSVVGHGCERFPLRAFDVNLQHHMVGAIAVLRHLVRDRVEAAPILIASGARDAFGVEVRTAPRTLRHGGIETVVLVHGDGEPHRYRAAPPVVSGNAVGISGLHGAKQIAAEEIAAVVLLAEAFHAAIHERHRAELREDQMRKRGLARRCLALQMHLDLVPHDQNRNDREQDTRRHATASNDSRCPPHRPALRGRFSLPPDMLE
jgi:hypothetical protein